MLCGRSNPSPGRNQQALTEIFNGISKKTEVTKSENDQLTSVVSAKISARNCPVARFAIVLCKAELPLDGQMFSIGVLLERILMALFRSTTLVTIFAFAVSLGTAAPIDQNTSAKDTDIDRYVRPGDDFYRYANGNWLRTATTAGQAGSDTRTILAKKTNQQVRDLIQRADALQPIRGSVAQKVGDYYASFIDEDGIEAKGLTPLATGLAVISAITNKTSLSAYLGTTLNSEVDGLTDNADHIFGVWVNQGFADSDHYVFHLLQGGLGMPDRDDYIDPSPKMAELRAQYKVHIAAILKLANVVDSESKAARILTLETRIAQSHALDSDASDVFKQNNPWKRADFSAKAPGMDWDAYFKSAGVGGQSEFIVWQPSAVTGTSALVGSEDIDLWKDYLKFHVIEHYASVLPKAVAAEDFAEQGEHLFMERAVIGQEVLRRSYLVRDSAHIGYLAAGLGDE